MQMLPREQSEDRTENRSRMVYTGPQPVAHPITCENGLRRLAVSLRRVSFDLAQVKRRYAERESQYLPDGGRLAGDGYHALAEELRRFAEQMPRPQAERERIAVDLISRANRLRDVSTPTR